jgi:hypothetical protein
MASEPPPALKGEGSALEPRIGRRAIGLPVALTDVVDVLLDDVRVFSISPKQGEGTPAGRRRVEWPSALKPFLKGSTTVTLRSHTGGDILAREEVTFGRGTGRVRVTDPDGNPLIMNKWGHLERPLAPDSADTALMLDTATELVTILEGLGLRPFIAYGSLLGAVRNGHVIGHDTDVDVAYYSSWEHPADLLRESFAIQRRLAELGWRVRRRSGACLQVRKAIGDGHGPRVDLFTAYHCNGWFAVERWVRGRLDRDSVLPLGEIELEGVRFPAPNNPEALLALTYGESWRVPDPAFKYHLSRAIRYRSEGWFGLRSDRVRWREASRQDRRARLEPSAFARRVDAQLPEGTTVVEVGCGSGADAIWFARDGRHVLALDYVPAALTRARRNARQTPSARFEQLNLNDLRQVLTTGTKVGLKEPEVALYAHHLLDSLRSEGRDNLWLLAKILLGGRGHLFVDFQTRLREDGSPQRVDPPLLHGLDPDEVVAQVTARGGRMLSRVEVDDDGRRTCQLTFAFAQEDVADV